MNLKILSFRHFQVFMAALVLAAMAVAAEGPQAPSGAGKDASVARAFEFVVTGMRQEHAKLASGLCRFSGRLVQDFPETPERNLDGPIAGLLALDHGKRRFDITRPDFIVDRRSVRAGAKTGAVVGQTIPGVSTRRFADDLVRTTFWHSDNDVATIMQTRDVASRRNAEYVDIWGITLYSQLAIERQYTFEDLCEQIVEFGKREGAAVAGLDSPVWTLSWLAPAASKDEVWQTTWILRVDTQRGFTPRLYRCQSTLTPKGRKLLAGGTVRGAAEGQAAEKVKELLEAGGDRPFLEWENETDWAQVDGVWVPTRHASRVFRIPSPKPILTRTLNFHWERVNRPVDPELFTYKTFDLPERVGVQDLSGGQVLWVKPLPRAVEEPAARVPPDRRKSWGFVLGAAPFLVLLLLIALRSRRRANPTG